MILNGVELVDFCKLSEKDKELVLEWRNNDEVRKWMYNQEIISLENHVQFIESLKKNDRKKYFMIKKEDRSIGVIDFLDIDYNLKFCDFGIYANPNINIPGIGRILEEVSISYAFEVLEMRTLKLEVYSTNVKVINMHKKYKFFETGAKEINNQTVICMELKRENW